MKNKSNVLLFTSFALVLLAVGLVTVLQTVRQPDGGSAQDVRARAAIDKGLIMTATIDSTDQDKGVVIVTLQGFSDVQYAKLAQYGAWSITPPGGYDYISAPVGAKVNIAIDPVTFNVREKTATAKSITVVPR